LPVPAKRALDAAHRQSSRLNAILSTSERTSRRPRPPCAGVMMLENASAARPPGNLGQQQRRQGGVVSGRLQDLGVPAGSAGARFQATISSGKFTARLADPRRALERPPARTRTADCPPSQPVREEVRGRQRDVRRRATRGSLAAVQRFDEASSRARSWMSRPRSGKQVLPALQTAGARDSARPPGAAAPRRGRTSFFGRVRHLGERLLVGRVCRPLARAVLRRHERAPML